MSSINRCCSCCQTYESIDISLVLLVLLTLGTIGGTVGGCIELSKVPSGFVFFPHVIAAGVVVASTFLFVVFILCLKRSKMSRGLAGPMEGRVIAAGSGSILQAPGPTTAGYYATGGSVLAPPAAPVAAYYVQPNNDAYRLPV
jgi:hypothetical protein